MPSRPAKTARTSGTITGLAPSPRDPSLVKLEIDDEAVGTILRATCDELGLAEGARVSAAKSAAIAAAIDVAAARARALRMLAARDRSTAALREALVARGHGERAADAVVAMLEADGWIDDARFASERTRVLVERSLAARAKGRRGLSGAAIRARLMREGLDADTIDAHLRRAGIDPRPDDGHDHAAIEGDGAYDDDRPRSRARHRDSQ
jgi:regulatory protein